MSVHVTQQHLEKAQKLASEFNHSDLSTTPLDELQKHSFDVIINATSAGLSGHVPNLPSDCLTGDTVCYDMVYLNGITPFNQWAKDHKVQITFDGLGMLVEQAAESFALWRGVTPDTKSVLTTLRSML